MKERAKRKILAFQSKRKLMRRLDSSLLKHAAEVGASPSVERVYQLQGLSETHFLLRNGNRLTPDDIEGLSRFADPLEVAEQCRRINGGFGMVRISDLLDEMNAGMLFPLSDTKNNRFFD